MPKNRKKGLRTMSVLFMYGTLFFNIQSNEGKMRCKDLRYILTKEINMIVYVSKHLQKEVRNEK